jgi:DNA-binding transcriptional ArsR family regulator
VNQVDAANTPGALPELDPVIHAQPRLRVAVALAALPDDDKITFPRLQELTDLTAGNLATHLRKLEDAGYVTVTKAFRRRTPVTYIALTPTGRRALEDYTAALRALLAIPSSMFTNGSHMHRHPSREETTAEKETPS